MLIYFPFFSIFFSNSVSLLLLLFVLQLLVWYACSGVWSYLCFKSLLERLFIYMFFFSKVIEVMLFVFIISKLKIKKEIKESMCVNEEKKTQNTKK